MFNIFPESFQEVSQEVSTFARCFRFVKQSVSNFNDGKKWAYKYKLREKCPNAELFLVRIFLSVFSPNTRKYGPEITPYFDTFHVVTILQLVLNG